MNRNKLEIYRDILKVIITPTKISHIMNRAGTNYSELKKFLEYLLKNGLCEKTHNPKLSKCKLRYPKNIKNDYYYITKKGQETLNQLTELEISFGLITPLEAA
jgi:predicted transcriptional regulator